MVAVVVLALLLRGDPREASPDGTASPAGSSPTAGSSATAGDPSSTDDDAGVAIEIDAPPEVVGQMTPVPLTGRVQGASPGSSVTVQSSSGAQPWTSFPLRPVVDEQGRFRTFVELGAAGVHRLRVVEPRSGAASGVVVVRVE